MEHGLAYPVGKDGQIHIGADVAAPPSGPQGLQHRLLNGRRVAQRQIGEFPCRAWAFEKRHLQGGAVPHRAVRDGRAQSDDLLLRRALVGGVVESGQCLLADLIEIGVIAVHQLDEDGFFGIEMVIEAARQDAGGVGDLLQ